MAGQDKDSELKMAQELKNAAELAKKDKLTADCMGVLIAEGIFPFGVPRRALAEARKQCPGFAAFCNKMQRAAEMSSNKNEGSYKPAPRGN